MIKGLLAAKRFIIANGGIEESHMFTKIMLAITGQMKWPSFFPIPIELMLFLHLFLSIYMIFPSMEEPI